MEIKILVLVIVAVLQYSGVVDVTNFPLPCACEEGPRANPLGEDAQLRITPEALDRFFDRKLKL